MKKQRANEGFTIIELLIAVIVIGILAGLGVVSYNGVQNRAKDVRTEDAYAKISDALEFYYIKNKEYPAVCPNGDNMGCYFDAVGPALVPKYMSKLPDAYPSVYDAGVFSYVRGTSGQTYAIFLRFEGKPDCKRGVGVQAGWWGAGLATC